ncbi:NADPH2:quinone reductase [Streptomyces aurantiacus]|uniref:zinc-binding dehydrogenase n=1 Tax=Streptomyces aurantiacus TaxID=47760 RepID=UPI002790C3D2|nr:zinc-binding dehydrogenase [Streptomyces aurantiacus]MDQ0777083.1 NADPH2:quinone reductase [Streptomyces aurantiacus]
MKALTIDHSAPGHLALTAVADPEPAAHQALVQVHSFSLNSGEVHYVIPGGEAGTVPGWDAAGVVVQAAADGSGPAAGTPVVTVGADGAWAELRAVDTHLIGTAPEGADLGPISTLPVAAGTALRVLHRIGPILGRRILVTGAGGGVGRFTLQLAARGGAHVTAVTSDPAKADALRALGAHEIVTELAALQHLEPVHGVVELVGGAHMVAAHGALAEHGVLVAAGHIAGDSEQFPHGAFFGSDHRHNRQIATYFLLDDTAGLGSDLTWLAALTARGGLDPQVALRTDWTQAAWAAAELAARRVPGKAVLDVR